MAKIKGEIDVTPEAERTFNELVLPDINAEREAQDEAPFANADDYASFVLSKAFESYVEQGKDKKKEDVADKYDAADPSVQAQVDALLG